MVRRLADKNRQWNYYFHVYVIKWKWKMISAHKSELSKKEILFEIVFQFENRMQLKCFNLLPCNSKFSIVCYVFQVELSITGSNMLASIKSNSHNGKCGFSICFAMICVRPLFDVKLNIGCHQMCHRMWMWICMCVEHFAYVLK